MFCALIVAAFAAVNVVAGLKYPPLLLDAAAFAVLIGVIVHNLVDERRLQ